MTEDYQGLRLFNNLAENNFQNCLKSADPIVTKILELDSLFRDSYEVLSKSDSIQDILFFQRSRSFFLSATRVGFGGQSPDVYPLARAMLESALYAWFIKQDSNRFTTWIERLRGGDERTKAKKLFAYNKIMQEFDVAHPQMAKVVRESYEFHIDFGAHPNASGVISGMNIIDNENTAELRISLLHGWERDSFHVAIKEIARTAVGALEIYRLMWPVKFKAAGLEERILKVMQGL